MERGADEASYVAPRNKVEEILCGIWAKLLKVESAGVQDNFFELGGDSILSIQVISRAEAASENIFVVRDGTLYTNDEKDSILLGITRLSIIQIARDLGHEVKITRLRVDDVLSSHETFVTGTAAEVIPICHVDGKMIADGRCGPITEQIQKQYMRIVRGADPGYAHWLRPVRKAATAQI
jgi:hypothetical protein